MVTAKQTGNWNVLVAGAETRGSFALIEARVWQGAEPPRHVHSREDIYVYVLEGCLAIELDGDRRECPAGAGLLLKRGSEHAFAVVSDAARLLIWLSPAGLETCLGELGGLGASDGQIERLVAIAARYGVAITGPARPP